MTITVTITAPKQLIDFDAIINNSIVAMDKTIDNTKKDFDSTKKDFKSPETQFEFEVQRAKLQGKIVSGFVRTDNENYVRLSNGFDIKPIVGKRMSFYPGYNAKTARGIIPSRPGGPIGPNKIVRMSRKGTHVEGRQFDLVVRNANITEFYKGQNAAFAKAAAKSK